MERAQDARDFTGEPEWLRYRCRRHLDSSVQREERAQ